MQAYEQRVVDEKRDLDEKLAKLTTFIKMSPVFAGLASADKELLWRQQLLMHQYSTVLLARIARFAA